MDQAELSSQVRAIRQGHCQPPTRDPLRARRKDREGDAEALLGGAHRLEVAVVKVPCGVDPVSIASAGDNMADGYRAVAPQLESHPGAPVLIVGGAAKSVGLYAAGIAVALGASRVDYLDDSERRLRMAERLGANPVLRTKQSRWFGAGEPVLPGGYAISVEASGTTRGLAYALTALAPGGVCTAIAFYLRRGTPLPLWNMYMKSASLHVGVSHPRTHLPALLKLVERGAFDPSHVTPLVGDWQDAHRVLLEPATKVIVQRKRLLATG
jgi:alcohol dehydrogenase